MHKNVSAAGGKGASAAYKKMFGREIEPQVEKT